MLPFARISKPSIDVMRVIPLGNVIPLAVALLIVVTLARGLRVQPEAS